MRRRLLVGVVLLVVLMAVAAAIYSTRDHNRLESFRRIAPGMSQNEVAALLGRPTKVSKSIRFDTDHHLYIGGEPAHSCDIEMKDGIVVNVVVRPVE